MANNTNYGYLISPAPQFTDANGKPYSGGKLKVYIAGTTNKAQTYRSWEMEANTWPIILDDMGCCQCIVASDKVYKFVLESADGSEPVLTRDNVPVAFTNVTGTYVSAAVESQDNSVTVTSSTDPDTGTVTYDLSAQDSLDNLSDAIQDEEDRATAAEAEARTEVTAGSNVTVTKTTDPDDGHDIYEVSASASAESHYGGFVYNGSVWTNSEGDVTSLSNVTSGRYHVTLRVQLDVQSVGATISDFTATVGSLSFSEQVDLSQAGSREFEFSGDLTVSGSLSVALTAPTGTVIYPQAVLWLHTVAGAGGGGGTTYTAGNGIDITGSTISANVGTGLAVDSNGKLIVGKTMCESMTYLSADTFNSFNYTVTGNWYSGMFQAIQTGVSMTLKPNVSTVTVYKQYNTFDHFQIVLYRWDATNSQYVLVAYSDRYDAPNLPNGFVHIQLATIVDPVLEAGKLYYVGCLVKSNTTVPLLGGTLPNMTWVSPTPQFTKNNNVYDDEANAIPAATLNTTYSETDKTESVFVQIHSEGVSYV